MLGCSGHPCIRTPHLDMLATEGIVFNQAYFSFGEQTFLEVFEVDEPAEMVHFCLEIDDIDGFIAETAAKGIECTPKKQGCDHTWQTWLKDPDGHAFEIHQYTDESLQFLACNMLLSF